MLILVKTLKNLDLGKNLQKSRFWSKLMKISILDKIAENVDYSQNFRNVSN